MAEPVGAVLGISAVFLSVVAVATNLTNLIQQLKQINDPKITFIKATLLAENLRTSNWADNMGIRTDSVDSDLVERIRPRDLATVRSILVDITGLTKRAEDKLRNLSLPEGRKLSARGIMARWKWLNGEFDDLALLVKAVQALNTALNEIAEPPPKYFSTWTFTRYPTDQFADSLSPSVQPSSSGSNLDLLRHTGPTPANQYTTADTAIGLTTNDSNEYYRRSIRNLFERCLRALRFIAEEMPGSDVMKKSVLRLKIWASGLFGGPLSLDGLLTETVQDERVNEDMRVTIVGILVDIALVEGERRSVSINSTCVLTEL